jgi:hypothetical protein
MTGTINESTIIKAAVQFGKGIPTLELLGSGLIHRTYKVNFTEHASIVLQCINQATFSQPENIINNYRLVYDYLEKQSSGIRVPALLTTNNKKYFWIDGDNNFWRATEFIEGSYTPPIPESSQQVFSGAKCFAALTGSLKGLDTETFDIIIRNFHDLGFRYQQFEDAIRAAPMMRLLKATHVISELRDRHSLVDFYKELSADEINYPTRIMHHDCKVSNILFNKATSQVICPVDLDTLMPGKYFSDIGDMIRTMACTVDENSTAWEQINVNKEYYDAIVSGYMEGMETILTEKEKQNIHQSGLILAYMQSLRFVTDFLNNDIYYKTSYPEQNLNRALNQLLLLERLETLI